MIERFRNEFGFIKGNFLILVLSWILMDFAREIPGTYYGLYVKALGGSASIVGLIAFTSLITQALVQFPGGYLADKYGRKWLISTMTFGVAVAYVFYALAPNWQTIMIGSIISSLCLIYGPALNAIIADSLPQDRRGMGFSIMNLINSVSTTPAPLVASWLFTQFGLVRSMRIGYSFVAFAFLVAGLFRLRLRETLSDPENINGRELLGIYPKSISEGLRVWRDLPRSAFVLFLTNIIGSFATGLFQPIMIFWIVDHLGISEVNWAFIITTLFVSMIILAIPIGKIIDRTGKKRPLMVAYILWILLMPLFLWGNFYRLLVAMPLIGVLQITLMASSSSLMADLVPREHRGKVSGSTGFFTLITAAVGQLVGGFMYDNISHALPWQVQVVFALPSLLITFLFIEEPKEEDVNGE
ncbi:MAG: MFS transporter [Candidatus Bathyarchaeota archaeon]|nr:MAG: MFS transporter [Candidatus Bathyarchaeota archaeon]